MEYLEQYYKRSNLELGFTIDNKMHG